MCMIGTEKSNKESTRINAASTIGDKIKGLKSIFSEECIKLCSYENRNNGVKGVVNNNGINYVSKLNRRHYHLQKGVFPIHEY